MTCAVLALTVVVGGFAAMSLSSIAGDLKRARTMIDAASAQVIDGRLGEARNNLAAAEQVLIKANGRLYGEAQFDLLGWMPGIDRTSSLRNSGVGRAPTRPRRQSVARDHQAA